MVLRVKFEFDKLVSYWNSEHGAGVMINGESNDSHWHIGIDIDFEEVINDESEIEDVLKSHLDKYGLPSDYLMIMDDGRVSFTTLEDGDSEVIDEDVEKRMSEDREQVYLCNYSVFIEIQRVNETPTLDQLKEIFPSAEY